MDFSALLDIFLHLDKHLEMVVQNYGVWVYALMFARLAPHLLIFYLRVAHPSYY